MAGFTELKDLIKIALGTPETVNFKALHKLLVGIVQRLAALYGKSDGKEAPDEREQLAGADPRRGSGTGSVGLELKSRSTSIKSSLKKNADRKKSRADTPAKVPEESETRKKTGGRDVTAGGRDVTVEDEKPKPSALKRRRPSKKGSTEAELEDDQSKEGEGIDERKEEEGGRRGSMPRTKRQSSIAKQRPAKDKGKRSERSSDETPGTDEPNEPTGSDAETEEASSGSGRAHRTGEEEEGDVELEDENDSDYYLDHSDSTPLGSSVQKQDFLDIVKRIEVLEKECEAPKGKEIIKVKTKEQYVTSGGSSILPSSTDDAFERFELKEKAILKMIEKASKEAERGLDQVEKQIIEMRNQLQYLPHPTELYKSFYPSWKMLEDIMCPHPTLKANILEVKDSIETGRGKASEKQLSKFLGSPGPSDRLFNTFDMLSRVLEQQRNIQFDSSLIAEVAEGKKDIASKKASTVSSSGKMPRKSIPPDSLKGSFSMDEEETESVAAEEKPEIPLSGSPSTATDGLLSFKMAKVVEQQLNMRKEMDELQHWKDKVNTCEDDVRELADLLITFKKDLQLKEEKDHEVLTNLQMDMSTFQTEICGAEAKKAVTSRKAEMDALRQNMQEDRSLGNGLIVDRESRIRTQQLQMQMNALYQMMVEMQQRYPDIQYSSAPTGMPDDMQHPWGTGRKGMGTNMRTGVGTTATAVPAPSPPKGRTPGADSRSPSTVTSPITALMEARPSPLGGSEEKSVSKEKSGSPEKLSKGLSPETKTSGADLGAVVIIRATDTKSGNENQDRIEQNIVRISTAQNMMSTKLEAICNQQSREIRRLQDLMSRMHRENMTHYADLQAQIGELLGNDYSVSTDSLAVVPATTPQMQDPKTDGEEKAEVKNPESALQPHPPLDLPRPESLVMPRSIRRSLAGEPPATAIMVDAMKKELMAYIKSLRRRVADLEGLRAQQDAPEVDAAALKRPVLHRFRCLSCDKRVEVDQVARMEGVPMLSPTLPELPRIAPSTGSPPRLRSYSHTSPRVRPVDVYEIPRQCGGSYTASNKPRRVHYYNNLGEVIDSAVEPTDVERVDVQGSDGHIYKGHVQKGVLNVSNNFDLDDLLPGKKSDLFP